jgi:3-oxoacyl-[acyl-carrier protein] reductase
MSAKTAKAYVVTGGSRGIGRAVVMQLARAGAHILFTYQRNEAAARLVCEECAELAGCVTAQQADVQDLSRAREVIEQSCELFGHLDGVVTNAGVARDRPLVMMNEEDWDEVIATDLKGTFNYARAALYQMIRQRFGRVICISSVGGLIGRAGQTNYSAAKAGVFGFVRSLALEVASYGITVNAVAPGFIETEMWESLSDKQRNDALATIPLGRPGQPNEVAATVRFLLSDEVAYMTGSVLVIDGGISV